MNDRRSIDIEGLHHLTAIPVASRIGPLLVSSVISPYTPGSREVPALVTEQVANLFRHVDLMLSAAGGNWSHVAKMEFWVGAEQEKATGVAAGSPTGPAAARAAIEACWLERFPDPKSRPARHTHVGTASHVSASFMAYLAE